MDLNSLFSSEETISDHGDGNFIKERSSLCDHGDMQFEFDESRGDEYTIRRHIGREGDRCGKSGDGIISVHFDFTSSIVRDRVLATLCFDSTKHNALTIGRNSDINGHKYETINPRAIESIEVGLYRTELFLDLRDIASVFEQTTIRKRIVHDVHFYENETYSDILGEVNHIAKKRDFVLAFLHGSESSFRGIRDESGTITGFDKCIKASKISKEVRRDCENSIGEFNCSANIALSTEHDGTGAGSSSGTTSSLC